jgi:hypothetical protein
MPSFPPPGAVTICEINRDLGKHSVDLLPRTNQSVFAAFLTRLFLPWPRAIAADALSDDRAKDAYGNVLVSLLPKFSTCICSSVERIALT